MATVYLAEDLKYRIRYGDVQPDTVISHGLFGSRSKRYFRGGVVSSNRRSNDTYCIRYRL